MVTVETFDNADNGGEDITTQTYQPDAEIDKVVRWLTTVSNGWDVSVTVTAEVTTEDDPNFQKAVQGANIADAVGVSAGTSDYFDNQEVPWSYVRFILSPGGDPTSGTLTVTTQRRRLGGD